MWLMMWVCSAATPKHLRRQRVLLDLVLSSPERVLERSYCGICGTQQHSPGRDLGVAAACLVASPQPSGAGAWGEERGCLWVWMVPGLLSLVPWSGDLFQVYQLPWVGNLQVWGAAHHRAGVLQGCMTQGKKNSPNSPMFTSGLSIPWDIRSPPGCLAAPRLLP